MPSEIPGRPTASDAPGAGSAALEALITLTRQNESLVQALYHEKRARLEHEQLSADFRKSWSVRLGLYLRSWLCPSDSLRRVLYRFIRQAAFLCRKRGPVMLVRKGVQKLCRRLAGKDAVLPPALPGPSANPLTPDTLYRCWINSREPDVDELQRQMHTRFPLGPTISVVVPAHDVPLTLLFAALESVRAQTYPRWQLCVASASTEPTVRTVLAGYPGQDERIRLMLLPEGGGADDTTRAALGLATGEHVAFLDHQDTLAPFALFEVVQALNRHPDADLLYSDEDRIDACGSNRSEPFFKPAWSPDTLRSYHYLGQLTVYRRALFDAVGGVRAGFEGAQDHDLALRATERCRQIVHIPQVLYHRRERHCEQGVSEAGRKALREHLTRLGLGGEVDAAPGGTYQVTYRLPRRPLVSILIPNKDQQPTLRTCLESIARSSYDNYEVIIVENNSRQPEIFAYYEELKPRPRHRVLHWRREFNYAAINNWAAGQARGEMLLLLNNDTEAINADWLERLLEHALRDEVGAVGAKLFYPDGTVQHGGVIVGLGGVADHGHRFAVGDSLGNCRRLVATQNLSAVTAACLMMRREVFEAVGGFDERFAVAFNDVDLCLKVRQAGKLIVWTPHARLWHYESKSRGPEDTVAKQLRAAAEIALYRSKWADLLREGDPYYNPNLTHNGFDFAPEPSDRPPTPRASSLEAADVSRRAA
jgi:GT2 family glycosyltransferase